MSRFFFLLIICSTGFAQQGKKPISHPQPSAATVIANLTAKLDAAQQQNRKLRSDLATTTASLTRLRKEYEALAASKNTTTTVVKTVPATAAPAPRVNIQYLKDSIRNALIKSGTLAVHNPPAPKKEIPAAPPSYRLDACILKNRQLSNEISQFNSKYQQLEIELNSAKYFVEQEKRRTQIVRDSVKLAKKDLLSYREQVKIDSQSLMDSLESLKQFKEEIVNEKQKVVSDTNIVRVYDLPLDVVRIKVLRKVLDETSGLVLEKNMDDGFIVSRIYKDRYAEGMFKKVMSSKVDCTIKMIPHPIDPEKTIFYANTKLQEKKQEKLPFTDQIEPKMVKDYQNKLLSFFDSFLVK